MLLESKALFSDLPIGQPMRPFLLRFRLEHALEPLRIPLFAAPPAPFLLQPDQSTLPHWFRGESPHSSQMRLFYRSNLAGHGSTLHAGLWAWHKKNERLRKRGTGAIHSCRGVLPVPLELSSSMLRPLRFGRGKSRLLHPR